ncbi:glycosyltransferase family 2 protein [Acidiphilium iwatense]|uniref:Glycosyltransferase family 2 protein n=1 Tax=Acidiphilium iwatense TaxID=768198 RepID=A0ABS9E3S6_9PROT|nr:glycosyltransferase family 2 protein [Acidiphilium iwatense]MCF3948239.1 glycosyltransferase family 2 protein [Acidiphilium iwatense]
MTRIASVAVVKDEERHIAEWIAYQFAVGFDTVVLFDNGSTDQTVTRARALAAHRDVRVIDWPVFAPDYQVRAYEDAARRFTGEFDWLGFFDTDEFLVMAPDFDLRAILALWRDAAAIGVPWAIFGSSGHVNWPDGLVIEEFVYRAQPSFGPNRHIKSIIRPERMKSCLNAHAFEMDGVYRGLAGNELSWSQPGVLDCEPDYRMGKLHHYFTRSQAHWDAKIRRGYHDTDRKASEFEAYDRNEVFDDAAVRYAPMVCEELAMIKFLNSGRNF